MTETTKISLAGWLDLVSDYWSENGKLCDKCEWNDPDNGCDFLYARSIPEGECPGVDIRQSGEADGY